MGRPSRNWAILIGINFYREKERQDCLKGCVRDVNNFKQYLTEPGSTPVHIEDFIASTPSDPCALCPPELPEKWLTFPNITSSFQRVIDDAEPEDCVYIHYSGHGTRSIDHSGDLALCLFDERLGTRYLRAVELLDILGRMVRKGLFVTVVFDCCFSGSVLRHSEVIGDAATRTIPFEPMIDAAYPPLVSSNPGSFVNRPFRDATIVPRWMVNPDGYTILAACGPHEKAFELRFKTDLERNGALSYFLHRALVSLRSSGVEIMHRSLYQHICTRFHADFPRQNPVRYGNSDLTFYGRVRSGLDMTLVSVFERQSDRQLMLAAGHAHGISRGDRYAVYPLHTSEEILKLKNCEYIAVEVGAVHGLTSELTSTDSRADIRTKTGWKARPLIHFSLEKIPTRLTASLKDTAKWIAAAEQRRFVRLMAPAQKEPCLFAIVCSEHAEYEIRDQSDRRIESLPTVPAHNENALEIVLNIIDHVCTYKYIANIENRIPLQDFISSFSVQLLDSPEGGSPELEVFKVMHNQKLQLRVQNFSKHPLYVHVYNLTPNWQIKCLVSADGGGDFLIIEPEDAFCGEIQPAIPDSFISRGQRECDDILKIFFTRRPSSFASLALPSLHDAIEGKDDSRRLSDFLSILAKSTRGPASTALDEEWMVRNFAIRLCC